MVEEIKADDNIEITNNDNDDSINLTIGEEDEQLFEENDIKPKGNCSWRWFTFLVAVHWLTNYFYSLPNNDCQSDKETNENPIESDSKPEDGEKPSENTSDDKSKSDRWGLWQLFQLWILDNFSFLVTQKHQLQRPSRPAKMVSLLLLERFS